MSIVKSEFYKLKRSRPFLICLSSCAIFGAFMAFAMYMGVTGGDTGFNSVANNLSGIEMIRNSLINNFFEFFCAVFIAVFVSSEFHNGTMKNYLSKGVNRVQIYLSKLVVCSVAVLSMFVVYITASCIAGTVIWGFDPRSVFDIGNVLSVFFSECLLMFAYTSVFLLFSVCFRNYGASIGINTCSILFLPILLYPFNYIVNFIIGGSIKLSNYWIAYNVASTAKLVPTGTWMEYSMISGIIVSLCFIVGATIAGSTLFKKIDIK